MLKELAVEHQRLVANGTRARDGADGGFASSHDLQDDTVKLHSLTRDCNLFHGLSIPVLFNTLSNRRLSRLGANPIGLAVPSRPVARPEQPWLALPLPPLKAVPPLIFAEAAQSCSFERPISMNPP